jgi:hypothetical protein
MCINSEAVFIVSKKLILIKPTSLINQVLKQYSILITTLLIPELNIDVYLENV